MSRLTLTLSCLVALAAAGSARADLAAYVKKKEPDYAWKQKAKREVPQGTVYELELVSQKWQGVVWKHELVVHVPKDTKPGATMLLYNTGGKASAFSTLMAFSIANDVKAPIAFLYGIPNQPLLADEKNKRGYTEDALIAETFLKYLDTKDASWPLLFPMVKSVVKAFDALQEFSKKEWGVELAGFVLSGGSKRGWTTWLTGSVEPRLKGIAPMVIDTLNMQKQLPHQKASYGEYSAMIRDYTERKLVPMPDTAEAKRLWSWVDPWVYREQIRMPKLIINGTNDPYWTQDALNLYWDDLRGDKYICYVPNAGHDLNQGGQFPDLSMAGHALAAFTRSMAEGKPLPKLTWKHEGDSAEYKLKVNSDVVPKAVRLWTADAATKDFRKSKWTSQTLKAGKEVTAAVSEPKEGCRVFFAECQYEMDKMPYSFSTQVRIVGTPRRKEEK